MIAAMERDNDVTGLHVDFSSRGESVQSNGIFVNSGIRGMLEGKDYRSVNTVFPIMSIYSDRVVWFQGSPNLTEAHAMSTTLMNKVMPQNNCREWSARNVKRLWETVRCFKRAVVELFPPVCTSGLFTILFHVWTIWKTPCRGCV